MWFVVCLLGFSGASTAKVIMRPVELSFNVALSVDTNVASQTPKHRLPGRTAVG